MAAVKITINSKTLRKLLRKWPGARTFGVYRFLPGFFVFGAFIEYAMIKWTVGEVNFYKTFKQRQVENLVEEKLRQEREELRRSD